MTTWKDRLRAALGSLREKPEADVSYDPARVSRAAGPERAPGVPDLGQDTGTTPDDEYVGRVTGDEDVGETGAERRAETERRDAGGG